MGRLLLGEARRLRADVSIVDVGEVVGAVARVVRAVDAGAGGGDELRVGDREQRLVEPQREVLAEVVGRLAVRHRPREGLATFLRPLLFLDALEDPGGTGVLVLGDRHARQQQRDRRVDLVLEEGRARLLALEVAELQARVDGRLRLAELRGDRFDGVVVLVLQPREGVGLLEFVDVGALAVLEDLVLERLLVGALDDDAGDARLLRELRRAPAALAVDDLVVALARGAHADGDDDAVRGDGRGELLELVLLEHLARVRRRGLEPRQLDLEDELLDGHRRRAAVGGQGGGGCVDRVVDHHATSVIARIWSSSSSRMSTICARTGASFSRYSASLTS